MSERLRIWRDVDMDERFDMDVSYRDPLDPRDDFPDDKPNPGEYEDRDAGHAERCGFTELGMGQREWSCTPDCPVRQAYERGDA